MNFARDICMLKHHYQFQVVIWTVFFAFIPFVLFSTEEMNPLGIDHSEPPLPLACLEGEPSVYVYGCVNVITGQFVDSSTDLISYHGVDPITIERSFFGTTAHKGNIGRGWFLNHHSRIQKSSGDDKHKHKGRVTIEEQGGSLPFCSSVKHLPKATDKLSIPISLLKEGVCNTSSGYIGGQTNIKNWRLLETDKHYFTLFLGNGGKKYFTNDASSRLESEIKPTGNQWLYSYHSHGNAPDYIHLVNKNEELLQYVHFDEISNKQIKKTKTRSIHTSDGRWVRYNFAKLGGGSYNLLSSVERCDAPTINYSYYNFSKEVGGLDTIWKKEFAEGRFIEMDYYDSGRCTVAGNQVLIPEENDPRIYRVNKLLAPAGVDKKAIPIYQFIYHLNVEQKKKRKPGKVLNGSCDVYNALGYRTNYSFDENHRLKTIDKYQENDIHYARESLFWGENEKKDTTNLIARSLEEKDKGIVFAKIHKYDSSGNVITDTLYGNLSGNSIIAPFMQPDGKITENGAESYKIQRTYSKDGFNLLLSETDGIQTTTFRYALKTNLLIAKYQNQNSSCSKRWFYSYNDDGAVTIEIVDDGTEADRDDLTGVTERLITYYTQSTVYPVAFPLVIEQKCLDIETGNELRIHKTVNTYNTHAKITHQDHYGSDGEFAYSLSWEYDDMGNIIKETDAAGRVIQYRYDANGNCIFRQGPDNDCTHTFLYDFMNRLIRQDDVYIDGVVHTTLHRYDLASNRIATIDKYGQETKFTYDPFGRLTEVLLPETFDENDIIYHPSKKKKYDAMGNVTHEIDITGNETIKTYTIRGQVASTIYPDGNIESILYQLNGPIQETKSPNGLVTRYTNDPAGRATKVAVYAPNEELLSSTTSFYSTFHILSETDAMGVTSYYSYYPNGNLKSQKKEELLITYAYDALGRLITTTEQYGPNLTDIIVKAKKYDILNRVIEETIADSSGNLQTHLSYTYDSSDRICQMTTHSAVGEGVTKTTYNPRGVPSIVVDAEGNETRTICDNDYRNSHGQHVAHQIVIDPLGNSISIENDTLGRIVATVRKNAFGEITQKQEKAYDVSGNCVKLIDTIIFSGSPDREIITLMEYDRANRLIACYEAVGTPEQKQTKITYNQYGQKYEIIRTDGIRLTHVYDPVGRLSSLSSSDHTVQYHYHYDSNGNPIQIDDLVHNTITIKNYDMQNRMIKETLATNLTFEYTYDGIGRPLHVTLPDSSSIKYMYHANQLSDISRKDQEGNELYCHHYFNYDLAGRLGASQLPGAGGILSYTYDKLGRIKNISHEKWKEEIVTYDPSGHILEIKKEDEANAVYAYDQLYQLISESGNSIHTYEYDSHYNRRSKDGLAYTLNALNQLLSDGTYTYSYDLNGNMQQKTDSKNTVKYTYDALDRLTAVINGNKKTEYLYDESNRRLSKTHFILTKGEIWEQTSTLRFLYQGQNEIGACDEDDVVTELRVLGNGLGAEIGAAIAMEIGGMTYVPIHDHQGSPVCLLNITTGEKVDTYSYSSFGEDLFEESLIPWHFSSKRKDEESGFLYFGRRYYESTIGRWITPDPIGREGGPNLYAYVFNNPLSLFDLYGLSAEGGWDLEGIVETIWQACSSIFGFLSSGYDMLASFWKSQCPIPIVRDVLCAAGHFVRTGSLNGYEMEYSGEHSSGKQLYGAELNPSNAVVYAPGILNDFCSSCATSMAISRLFGNTKMYFLVNATHGAIIDIFEVACQKVGIPTNSVAKYASLVRAALEQVGPDGRLTLIGFSQGGQIIDSIRPYFTTAELKQMDVLTFGSAKMVSEKEFGSAVNYVSLADPIPFIADPLGCIKAAFNNDIRIEYLRSNSLPGIGHYFASHTYQMALGIEGREYLRNIPR